MHHAETEEGTGLIKRGKLSAKDFVALLRANGCSYDGKHGGILSKNGKSKGHMTTNGYKMVMLQKNGVEYYACEHRCVWWWHHPDTDDRLVIDHLNCDRADNRIENLEAVTSKENARRTQSRGRANTPRGERSGRAKLTDREALAIRYLNQIGVPREDIAAILLKDKSLHPRKMIDRVISKVRYGHLEDPSDIWCVYPAVVAASARTDLPRDAQINNALLGLSGEVGELVDLYKKHLYQGHPLDLDLVKEEAGDILFYLTWLIVLLEGMDRAEILLRNADKLQRRYPDGFSVERSVHRDA